MNNKIQELFTSNNIDIDSEQVEYFKKLLNDNRIKLASNVIGIVGGYLSACKLAQKVPELQIKGYLNVINNIKQFTKLRPTRSKRELLIIAILTLCAYYAIQSGRSLFALIKENINNYKSHNQPVSNILLSDENRYKRDRSVIEDSIEEKDWETLEDLLDSRVRKYPDLLKMIEKALKNKPSI